MAIIIVTDSTADLPKDLTEKLGIKVVPLNIFFGDTSYKDGVTMSSEQFYEELQKDVVHPKTSQPSPFDFQTVYKSIVDNGDEIISIHLSSKMSGTFQSASLAKGEMLGDGDSISVVDSKTLSIELGSIVLEAARLVKEGGLSRDEIVNRIEKFRTKTIMYFMVDTLKYLHKGGRIGNASALVGGLLKVKPILTVVDGEVATFAKARGEKKAIIMVKDLIIKEAEKHTIDIHYVYAENDSILTSLQQKLEGEIINNNSIVSKCGAVIGAHVGPGSIAIAIVPRVY